MAGRKKAFVEDQALDKALEVFWSQGYEATGTRDLAKAMDINYGSVYHTFKSKESLYCQCLDHGAPKMFQHFESIIYAEENALEGLQRMFQALAKEKDPLKIQQGCFVGNTMMEFSDQRNAILDLAQRKFQQFEEMFYRALKNAQKEGYLDSKSDCRLLATHLLSLYQGIMIYRRSVRNNSQLKQLIDYNFEVIKR